MFYEFRRENKPDKIIYKSVFSRIGAEWSTLRGKIVNEKKKIMDGDYNQVDQRWSQILLFFILNYDYRNENG